MLKAVPLLALLSIWMALPVVAQAQDIGPVRPDVQLQSAGRMQAVGTFVSDGSWQNCYILDGAGHLDSTNWFACKAITDVGGITLDHLVIVTPTGGNVAVRGITVNASGVPSEPSSMTKTVLSIPFGPALLSDSAAVAGTEDLA